MGVTKLSESAMSDYRYFGSTETFFKGFRVIKNPPARRRGDGEGRERKVFRGPTDEADHHLRGDPENASAYGSCGSPTVPDHAPPES